MDINCVSNCAHQRDGKCNLTEITPAAYFHAARGPEYGKDDRCPYFSHK